MKKVNFSRTFIDVLALIVTCLFVVLLFGDQNWVKAEEMLFESESNNMITEANEIPLQTKVAGTLESSSDVDWYSFTVPKDGVVWISFDHDYVNSDYTYWKTSVCLDANTIIATDKWVGNTLKVSDGKKVGLGAGEYFLMVEREYTSNKRYSFTINYSDDSLWERGLNETIVNANLIPLSKRVGGTLVNSSDTDWFSFELPSDGYIWITFEHEYIDSDYKYWITSVYDDENNVFTSWNWKGNATKPLDSSKIGLPSGKYYLKIDREYASSKTYYFTVNYKSSVSWETEFNDTIVTADIIPVNTLVRGSIMNNADYDWYRFSLDKSGKVRAMFMHDYVDSDYKYWRLDFYNDEGKTVNQKGYSCIGNYRGEAYTDELSLNAGVYYIRIVREYYSYVDYTLSVDYTSGSTFDTPRIDPDKNIGANQNSDGSSVKNDKGDAPVSADIEGKNTSAKVGTTFTVGALKYKVSAEDEVIVVGAATKVDDITIPDEVSYGGVDYTVIAIAKNSFKKNASLKKLTINADLDYIGENAFDSCKALTNLTIKGDVYTIKKKAFYNCKKLASITISTDSLEKIEDKAFARISSKVSIKVPSSLADTYKKLLKKGGMTS